MDTIEYGDTLEHRKKVLSSKRRSLKKQLEEQIEGLKSGVNKWGKTVAITGGTMLVTYLVVRMLTSSRKVEQPHQNMAGEYPQQYAVVPQKEESFILRAIKEEITLFLISFAKQKLMAFIEEMNKKKDLENS
jgi:hypothetical protein